MNFINKLLKYIFFLIIVRFIVLILLGLNIRNKERLPKKGPAIIIANHNSHLDTLVLIHLLSKKLLNIIHPVAAADYFLKNKLLSWFSQKIMGIIPISRKTSIHNDPLISCYQALEKGSILILFPEGTRGEPEQITQFKTGIAYIACKFPDIPIIPIYMHGLGKALPKNDPILVPFFCDVFIGKPIFCIADKETFMKHLQEKFQELIDEGSHKPWL